MDLWECLEYIVSCRRLCFLAVMDVWVLWCMYVRDEMGVVLSVLFVKITNIIIVNNDDDEDYKHHHHLGQ